MELRSFAHAFFEAASAEITGTSDAASPRFGDATCMIDIQSMSNAIDARCAMRDAEPMGTSQDMMTAMGLNMGIDTGNAMINHTDGKGTSDAKNSMKCTGMGKINSKTTCTYSDLQATVAMFDAFMDARIKKNKNKDHYHKFFAK